MKLVFSIAAGIILAIVLLAVGCSAIVASSVDDATPAAVGQRSPLPTPRRTRRKCPARPLVRKMPGAAPRPTSSTMAFSRKGLIQQLSSSAGEGFSRADATYAVNHIDVNWNEQAAKAAQSYLDTMAFSRQGLDRAVAAVGRGLGLRPSAGGVRR